MNGLLANVIIEPREAAHARYNAALAEREKGTSTGTKLQAFKRYHDNGEIEARYVAMLDNRGVEESGALKGKRAELMQLLKEHVSDKAARRKILDAVAEIEGENEFEGFMIGFRDAAQLYNEGGGEE